MTFLVELFKGCKPRSRNERVSNPKKRSLEFLRGSAPTVDWA